MKKIISILLTAALCIALCACGADKQQNNNGESTTKAKKGEVSVFYYTYSDTYISAVRSSLDKLLKESGMTFNNYDANGNQTTQTEQVQTAIAKGSKMLIVNVVDTGSEDAARHIIDLARASSIPVIFFNRSVDESVVTSYDKCIFIGTDYEEAGHLQGEMIGNYIVDNFSSVDLNNDGKISYVMFKGQEGNMEAIARTKYGVEDCNKVLESAGKPALEFYDASNTNKYLVDQNGLWSSAAATDYMNTILAQYSEANKNMVELVIANNDEMALGAVSSLQGAGYNTEGKTVIPVFGVDATEAAKSAIEKGSMAGTVKQDAEGMAKTITAVMNNYLNENDVLDGIPTDELVGTWRINIPYSVYTAAAE